MSTPNPPILTPEVDQARQSPIAKPATFALKCAALLLILGFLTVLTLPLATTDFRSAQTISQSENRTLNAFPAWPKDWKALETFPVQFEAAFNDHFGFRNVLVRWHSRFKVSCLGVSPAQDVVLGKEGWLYFAESVKEYRGIKTMPKQEVERWVRELKAKQAWLAAKGIRYVLVVAPNKEEVYPEYLPNNVCQLREHRFLDDILAGLGTDSGVPVLDLRDTLRDGKRLGLGPVYDRTDTHWSQLGAFLATNQILARLQPWFPELQPVQLSSRTLTHELGTGGDLAGMLDLFDVLKEDRLMVSSAKNFHSAPLRLRMEWPEGSLKDVPVAFESSSGQRGYTVLITGDSFGHGLMRYLPEHFRRIVRLRPDLPYTPWFQDVIPRLVEAEKPDIYLDVFCSRSLKHPPKMPFSGR